MSRHQSSTHYSGDQPSWIQQLAGATSEAELLATWNSLDTVYLTPPTNLDACDVLLRLANKLCIESRYSEATRLAEMSLQLSSLAHDEALTAEAQLQLGRCYAELGESNRATLAYLDAIAASRRCHDTARFCKALLWLSYVEQSKGHLATATEYANQAKQEALQGGLRFESASAAQHQGLYLTLSGKVQAAVAVLEEATSMFEALGSDLSLACALLSRAFADLLLEQHDSAEQLLVRARNLIIQAKSQRNLAISYEYEAALRLQQGKLTEAEAAIQECLRISLDEFPDGDMTSQGYRIWAEIDVRRGDFEAAKEHAMCALGVARRVGERIEIGAIERILAQCMAHQGDLAEARTHLSEALTILSDCGARYELALTYLVAGQLELFERPTRLAHLHTALSLFGEMEVEGKASEAEDAIRRLTSPPRRVLATGEPGVTILTRNRIMRNVIAGIDRVKNHDDIILLEGETGVGKDLLAKYIHETGDRADRPFVLFNAAAVPEALAESELFGHVRGAFSGAVREREGLLFAAKNGTFFFNEISEAPPAFQAKLLSVIETRKVRPVGSNSERPIEARLIFATNRNLEAEVQSGSFRKDLFYRMASARFVIPPLRERASDIDLLLSTFLRNEGMAAADVETLKASEGWRECMRHRWDGNVRELEMFARRLARELDHCPGSAVASLNRLIADLNRSAVSPRGTADEEDIAAAMARNGGNKRRAAAELGIPESTLRWKLKQRDAGTD